VDQPTRRLWRNIFPSFSRKSLNLARTLGRVNLRK